MQIAQRPKCIISQAWGGHRGCFHACYVHESHFFLSLQKKQFPPLLHYYHDNYEMYIEQLKRNSHHQALVLISLLSHCRCRPTQRWQRRCDWQQISADGSSGNQVDTASSDINDASEIVSESGTVINGGSTNVSRILVVTGFTKKTELLPKPESQCALQDFPREVYGGAVGFWTAQGPMVCGGHGGENKCFLFKEHQWMPWTNMGTARRFASALQITPNQALIIGGDENRNYLKSTELITPLVQKKGKISLWQLCSIAASRSMEPMLWLLAERKMVQDPHPPGLWTWPQQQSHQVQPWTIEDMNMAVQLSILEGKPLVLWAEDTLGIT